MLYWFLKICDISYKRHHLFDHEAFSALYNSCHAKYKDWIIDRHTGRTRNNIVKQSWPSLTGGGGYTKSLLPIFNILNGARSHYASAILFVLIVFFCEFMKIKKKNYFDDVIYNLNICTFQKMCTGKKIMKDTDERVKANEKSVLGIPHAAHTCCGWRREVVAWRTNVATSRSLLSIGHCVEKSPRNDVTGDVTRRHEDA